jgi:hypothetical protein
MAAEVVRRMQKDLRELPENVRQELEFVFAERIEEALAAPLPQVADRAAAAV